MRFVVTGEWSKNSLLRLIVLFFLLYVLLFWVTSILMYFNKMGLDYNSVVEYFRGSPEQYTQPRSYQGLLEVSHFHLFAMGILMVTVTHLLLFIPLPPIIKVVLIVACFGSAFLNELSSWLVRFAHPGFAYLKIASFLALQVSLFLVVSMGIYGLLRKSPSAYMDTDSRKKR